MTYYIHVLYIHFYLYTRIYIYILELKFNTSILFKYGLISGRRSINVLVLINTLCKNTVIIHSPLVELAETLLCCDMELIFRVRSLAPPIGAPSDTVGGVDPGTPRVETTAFACPVNAFANISSQRIKLKCTYVQYYTCIIYNALRSENLQCTVQQ